MSELKKCPFCGGEANLDELTPTPYNDQHSTYYSVGCINCGIGFYENTEQEAIAAWNRRADGWIPVGERVPDADESGKRLMSHTGCRYRHRRKENSG